MHNVTETYSTRRKRRSGSSYHRKVVIVAKVKNQNSKEIQENRITAIITGILTSEMDEKSLSTLITLFRK